MRVGSAASGGCGRAPVRARPGSGRWWRSRGPRRGAEKMAAAALRWALRAAGQVLPSACTRQVRSYFVDWRMLRDVKRRRLAYEYADERLRINAIRKNTILPKELQEVADKEIAALPRDSCPVRIRNRGPCGRLLNGCTFRQKTQTLCVQDCPVDEPSIKLIQKEEEPC
uniref:Mitochondrial ribosomal protein S14 n=1 Tax=Anas platyrhynchos platyrhynchos TaxID=8840 RepID=A0A493T171_ANAPP